MVHLVIVPQCATADLEWSSSVFNMRSSIKSVASSEKNR